MNARITFGNIFGTEEDVPYVSCIEEGDRQTCILDEEIFQIPPDYMQLGMDWYPLYEMYKMIMGEHGPVSEFVNHQLWKSLLMNHFFFDLSYTYNDYSVFGNFIDFIAEIKIKFKQLLFNTYTA